MLAQQTTLGFVIYGQTNDFGIGRCSLHVSLAGNTEDLKLDELLVKYWNADEIPTTRKWTIVPIPRKLDAKQLGNSHKMAMACFLNVEKKMQRSTELKRKYKDVM